VLVPVTLIEPEVNTVVPAAGSVTKTLIVPGPVTVVLNAGNVMVSAPASIVPTAKVTGTPVLVGVKTIRAAVGSVPVYVKTPPALCKVTAPVGTTFNTLTPGVITAVPLLGVVAVATKVTSTSPPATLVAVPGELNVPVLLFTVVTGVGVGCGNVHGNTRGHNTGHGLGLDL